MKRFLQFFTLTLLVLPGYSCRPRKAAIRLPGTVVEISDSTLSNPVYDTFRLGRLRYGEEVIKEFSIKNAGITPLIINKIDSDCGCIVTRYDRKPLVPEALLPFTLSFDSRGYRGYVIKRVEIHTTLRQIPLVFFIEAEVE